MKIENPRFRPEDLFTPTYWGEIQPPIKRYNTHPTSQKSRTVIKAELGKLVLPILRGFLKGRPLVEGSAYNPSNPELSGLWQHLPGTIALVDEESLTNAPKPDSLLDKLLPLEDKDVWRLNQAARDFVLHQYDSGAIFPSGHLNIWDDGMRYIRHVRIEALAPQPRSEAPVVYYPMPKPVDYGSNISWVARVIRSRHTERIGQTYDGESGGWWRNTSVEICVNGEPIKVSEEAVFKLGNLAIEQP